MIRHFITILAILASSQLLASNSFLDENEKALLEPNANVPGVMRYVSPDADLSSYSNILFGSVTMYFSDSSEAKDIDADEAKAISDAIKKSLSDATAHISSVQVVEQPGPGTVLINVSITQISMANKKRGLFGYTPIGFAMTTAGNLTGLRMQLMDANIEGEVVDSVTGEVLTLFQVSEIAPEKDKDTLSWNDVTQLFATLIQQTLSAEKG